MAFPNAALNSACISAFGETFSYTHALTLITEDVTAIRESASSEQDAIPGEYISLFLDVATVAPAKGDQLTISDEVWTAFKVVPDLSGGARVFFARTVNA